ncbi:DUF1643 domain-containing protein [Gordonia terrae]|uniref:DUF1643 domain-containing protein n=1 Tax=Gordonia terrae TaxID=2055 RepID=UPI003F6AB936
MHAVISPDGKYRYWLERELPWSFYAGEGVAPETACAFIMLNPSTADATQDDPTIRRCKHFATALGASKLIVANLYAYRATNPAELRTVDDPVGPENTFYLQSALDARHVVVAWGTHASDEQVARLRALADNTPLWCLGTTKAGAPRHPLYVPNTKELEPWGGDR